MAELEKLKQTNFPGQVHSAPGGDVVTTKLDDIINWARSNSLWPLTFATSCCGIEMMSVASAKYDFSRFGFGDKLIRFGIRSFPNIGSSAPCARRR